jgi:transposase
MSFVPCDRDTDFLLPPSLNDWLPVNHLARFVTEIVAQLDLTKLKESYAGRGSSAYHPEMLLAVLVYGYTTGLFSSRQLERSTYDSIAFRYLAANTHPDHDTIAQFRKRFLPELESLFVQVLRKSTVEPVFGIIKSAMGFRQFMLRGLQAVSSEWTLVCLAWNMKRLHGLKSSQV